MRPYQPATQPSFRDRQQPRLLLAAALLLTSACSITENRFQPGLDRTHEGHLILHLGHQTLCYTESSLCQSLDLIHTSFEKNRVARAYGLTSLARVADAGNLTELLIHPPDESYEAAPQGPLLYHLPITPETLTVWRVLEKEYQLRFSPTGPERR